MKHMIPNVSEWERKMARESQSYKPPSRNFHSRTELISNDFPNSISSRSLCKSEINIVIICSLVPSLYHWLQSRENKEIEWRLRKTAPVNLCHVTKFSLNLCFTTCTNIRWFVWFSQPLQLLIKSVVHRVQKSEVACKRRGRRTDN